MRGFQLIVADSNPLAELSDEQRALIDTLEMAAVSLDRAARAPRRARRGWSP